MPDSISDHYQQKLDTDKIITRLQSAYPDGPTVFQLAPVDQLHIGGIKASQLLLSQIESTGATKILDIGSGLGGLMRLINTELKTDVIGLDITHQLNSINHQLSALSEQFSTPSVITGDAHNLPFPDHSFDLIVMQHSLLNMPDKVKVLNECYRVLQSGGKLLLHEVLRGDNNAAMQYPVPWAREPENSCLITEESLIQELDTAGFKVAQFNDWSADALNWRKRQVEKESQLKETAQPVVSPAQILGKEFMQMGKNVMVNLKSDAARVVEVLASK